MAKIEETFMHTKRASTTSRWSWVITVLDNSWSEEGALLIFLQWNSWKQLLLKMNLTSNVKVKRHCGEYKSWMAREKHGQPEESEYQEGLKDEFGELREPGELGEGDHGEHQRPGAVPSNWSACAHHKPTTGGSSSQIRSGKIPPKNRCFWSKNTNSSLFRPFYGKSFRHFSVKG